jgi:4-amino-4-deoxy-L-arabinose transferase-like glycosyltransferase
LRTIVLVNLVLLAAIVALLYRIMAAIADRMAAALACLTFLLVFAFGHYDWCGNFNWVCPYSHEVTHGIGLSLVALHLLGRHFDSKRWRSAAAAGLASGLVFLTKAEIFLALAITALIAWGVLLWLQRPVWHVLRNFAIFAAAMLLAPAVAWGLLSRALPSDPALRGTLGGWPYVATMIDTPYHRDLRGINDLGGNLTSILLAASGYLLGLGFLIWLSLVMRRHGRSSPWVRGTVFLLTLAMAALVSPSVSNELIRPWPLFLLVMVAMTGFELWKPRRDAADRQKTFSTLILAIFALGLLARILLRTRVLHYGFGLAMPATLLLVAAAWSGVAARISAWGGDANVYRVGLLAFWLAAVGQFVAQSNAWYRAKTYPIGTGADQFLADDRAPYLQAAMDTVTKSAKPSDTLAVMPEGVMLNYLLRMRNPTPYTNFIPPEMRMFGEEPMLAAFVNQPPDWIILTQRDTTEFGARAFGVDYAQQIVAWVEEHYEVAAQFESPPPSYAVLVARRKPVKRAP